MDNAKLYVGNLDYGTTGERLQQIFAEVGTVVSAMVIQDKFSGRSKGFGFVEMSSPEEAQAAIERFHGKEIDGREVTVNIARPLSERPPRREGGGGFRGGDRRGGDRGGFRRDDRY